MTELWDDCKIKHMKHRFDWKRFKCFDVCWCELVCIGGYWPTERLEAWKSHTSTTYRTQPNQSFMYNNVPCHQLLNNCTMTRMLVCWCVLMCVCRLLGLALKWMNVFQFMCIIYQLLGDTLCWSRTIAKPFWHSSRICYKKTEDNSCLWRPASLSRIGVCLVSSYGWA